MANPTPRIAPLQAPYPPDAAAWLAKWMPPGVQKEPLVLFRTLATHGSFTDRMRPLASGILGSGSGIAPRDRELVIARTCARCGCEYEWGVHVATLGAAAGLPEAVRNATVTADALDPVWSGRERPLVQLVDALHDTQRIPADVWNALAVEWTEPQRMELIAIVGWYHMISYLANGLELPLEPWAARWPKA